jgi:hypothetical protein
MTRSMDHYNSELYLLDLLRPRENSQRSYANLDKICKKPWDFIEKYHKTKGNE